MYSSEPLHHFVDHYLAFLHESHPTDATLDGVHAYDDLLEDFSRPAIENHVRALAGFSRRLDQIAPDSLTPVERVEHPIVAANIRARLYELEEVRSWERNPLYYGHVLASTLVGQTLFAYAPSTERARRVLSKLRQLPRFLRSARENIKDPPGIYIKVGLETLRGVLKFVESDLPKAFADVDDLHLLGDLADASTEAVDGLKGYLTYLEQDLAPRARASFRLGRERLEEKLRLEEGIGLNAERLLAIALRELAATREEFRRVAGRLDGNDPIEAWRLAKDRHPELGHLVRAAQGQLDELVHFIERHDIVSIPGNEQVVVAPTPDFYRWSSASMWTPGPFESRPTPAYYYLTDVDPGWAADRQKEHLRDFNYPTLWSISIHEVYPGHFLHYQHLRQIDSKLRKSMMFSPASFIEGWAHYCEQMMVDAGFGRDDQTIRLGQLAEALIRLVRVIVAIRLHAEDMSVEQGMRLFRDEAFMEEATARREAERGTFDATYLVYSIGKLMLMKLRADYRAKQGSAFSLRTFHDTLLGNGGLPIWAHRQLMVGPGGDALD
jgi:uncharacterized protein (DUF885 family)